jgi:hypothetical protein
LERVFEFKISVVAEAARFPAVLAVSGQHSAVSKRKKLIADR